MSNGMELFNRGVREGFDDGFKAGKKKASEEIKALQERLIQAQNDAAKWRNRAIEAEAKRECDT